jgi:phage-related protein
VLDEASVSIRAEVREGEREARRAGERYGRAFADGANREAGRSSLADTLAQQVEQASERVVRARSAEADAADDVLAADARLSAERARGAGRTQQLVDAEGRLDDALRRFRESQDETRNATVRHGQAQSALQGEMARSAQSAGGLSGALSRVGRDADDSGNRLRGFGNATRDADNNSKGFAASLATLGLAAKGLSLILKPNIYAELIPVLLGAAAAAAELSGALLILPGVLTTAGLAFGTLKIATSGFGDALKNMGDPEKFAEALKKLSPSAQSAAIAIQSLKGRFDQLRNSLQEQLFAGLDKEIRATGATMMNVLQPAMESISSSANRMIKGLLRDFRSLQGQKVFSEIGAEGSRAFDNITRAVRPLVRAFLDVASVGAKVFADITGGAEGAAASFAAWIRQMKESGQLEAIMRRGIDAVKQLGTVVGNVFSIIGSIMRASGADGQTFLQQMVNITNKVDEFFKSMQGQFALGVFFDLVAAIQVVVAELKPLGPAVLAVMGAITRALQTAAPFVSPLAAAFGDLVIAITPLIELAGQVAAALLSGLTVVMTDLRPIITALVTAIQGFVTNALPGLKTGFSTAWAVAKPLLGVLAELALVVLPPLGTAFGLIVTALGPFLPLIVGAAVASAAWGKAAGLLTATLKLLGPALSVIKLAIQGVTLAFNLLKVAMLTNPFLLLAAAVVAIAALIYFHWDSIKAFLSATWTFIQNLASTVWNAIVAFFATVWTTVSGHFTAAWNALTSFLRGVWNGIRSLASSVWNGITSAISSAVSAVGNAIRAAWNAVTSATSTAWNTVRSTVSGAINSVVSSLQTAWNSITSAVSAAWNAVVNAVRTGVNNVLNFIRALPGQIQSAVGNLGNILVAAGRAAIQGLFRGLTEWWNNSVVPWLRARAQEIANLKGPVTKDRRILEPAGKAIMEGLLGGMEDEWSAIAAWLKSVAGQVNGAFDGNAGRIDLKTVIPQAQTPLASQVQSAFAAARGLAVQHGASGQVGDALDQAERIVNNIVVHNPQAERSSDTINRELRKLAALGGFRR